jgi:hypothetical protein
LIPTSLAQQKTTSSIAGGFDFIKRRRNRGRRWRHLSSLGPSGCTVLLQIHVRRVVKSSSGGRLGHAQDQPKLVATLVDVADGGRPRDAAISENEARNPVLEAGIRMQCPQPDVATQLIWKLIKIVLDEPPVLVALDDALTGAPKGLLDLDRAFTAHEADGLEAMDLAVVVCDVDCDADVLVMKLIFIRHAPPPLQNPIVVTFVLEDI